MTRVLAVFVLASVAFAADPAREQKLQQAITLMESKGDLAKAMPMFEDVARSSDRALAARALLYLGQAQERQVADKARATYERIVKDFGNQTEMVAAAQQRLAALGAPHSSGTLAKRLLCADCGDSEADFSADGRWMAFTHWDSGDLAIRDMSTGQVKRLMAKTGTFKDSGAYVETPVFSPDLRQIVYSWDVGERDAPVQLRIMANEVGAKARVLMGDKENAWYVPTAWSPDGKSVVVIIGKIADHTDRLARVAISDGSIRVLKSVGWRFRGGSWSHPNYSPDGQYIVYSARAINPSKDPPAPTDPKDEHIYLMAADGSSETEIVKTAGINRNPVWTPDGKHILFTSDRTGRIDLWSVAVQNGKAVGSPSLVSPGIENIAAMGVHGGSYYYESRQQGAELINIMDAVNPNAKPLETFVGVGPAWSPDGKSIAFKRRHLGGTQRGNGVTDDYDLVVHSLETGEERLYPTSLGFTGNGAPNWFHDGKSVMTGLHSSEGPRGVYRIDLKTGDWTKLPVTGGGLPALSPDDRTLYNRRNPDNMPVRIMSNDMVTGQERQIFVFPGTGRIQGPSLAISPDGKTLALGWMDRVPERGTRLHIGTVSVDGSNFRDVFARTDTLVGAGSIAWSKDGRSIFFNQEQPGGASHWALMRVPADGSVSASVMLAPGPTNGAGWFDRSPDGSRFAIGMSEGRQSEVWALDNVLSAIK
jgi:Tol biopolymer transport system component